MSRRDNIKHVYATSKMKGSIEDVEAYILTKRLTSAGPYSKDYRKVKIPYLEALRLRIIKSQIGHLIESGVIGKDSDVSQGAEGTRE
jgi:hypothetical protein